MGWVERILRKLFSPAQKKLPYTGSQMACKTPLPAWAQNWEQRAAAQNTPGGVVAEVKK
jgi:hypothetical protein